MSKKDKTNDATLIPRRDILKAAWAAPVVLAINPSLEIVAGSGDPGSNFQGLTPGYWKQFDKQHPWDGTGFGPDEYFDTIFGLSSPNTFGGTLGEAVWAKGGGKNALARHATAALLNAADPNINYPYTQQQIIDMVNAAFAANDPVAIETLKDKLATANELEL